MAIYPPDAELWSQPSPLPQTKHPLSGPAARRGRWWKASNWEEHAIESKSSSSSSSSIIFPNWKLEFTIRMVAVDQQQPKKKKKKD